VLKCALLVAVVAVSAAGGLSAAEPNEAKSVHELMLEDQADREPPGGDLSSIDWQKVGPRDAARRNTVRAMIEKGELKTGADFHDAALIFQHGSEPDDLLMAHVLAMAALTKGDADSRQLAAMTLDRYLHFVGKPQIFGTDYHKSDGSPMTQEPFDRSLVPVALRGVFCVPDDRIQRIMSEAFQQNHYPDLSKYKSEMPCSR
jgi:hypothetical protein